MAFYDETLQELLYLGRRPTYDELFTAGCRVGRNSAPALLCDLYWDDILDDANARVAGEFWSMAEFPERCLDHETWSEVFEMAGYTVDGQRVERPHQPVLLYRGSTVEGRDNWSWTDDREEAGRNASGFYRRRPGHLWVALVEPWRLLARNTGRGESEYVVDTDGMTIDLAQARVAARKADTRGATIPPIKHEEANA